jgi:hypothetical protein
VKRIPRKLESPKELINIKNDSDGKEWVSHKDETLLISDCDETKIFFKNLNQ